MSTAVRMPEKHFQGAVIDLARMLGWKAAHFRPAQSGRGWRTAVQGDGKGFPDLVMLRGDRLLVRELKVGRNKTTDDQDDWLEAFSAAGIDADVWTEDDLHNGRIFKELTQ